ncbi:hypothetical protein [Candidatus Solirubrobacter pratensis]|uniref:hypothetical protein n=1 Tax=Candidatus Solirubrobacter pratensis TaxID=1298857 RepID=UPI00041397B0|nr:hypothetical protein [Candidatus Solirubrobacter pratensis]
MDDGVAEQRAHPPFEHVGVLVLAAVAAQRGGERATVPELDAWMARSTDPMLAELAAGLSAGFGRPEANPLVALALDFWTWQRLDREGLDDAAAADVMTGAVRACAG